MIMSVVEEAANGGLERIYIYVFVALLVAFGVSMVVLAVRQPDEPSRYQWLIKLALAGIFAFQATSDSLPLRELFVVMAIALVVQAIYEALLMRRPDLLERHQWVVSAEMSVVFAGFALPPSTSEDWGLLALAGAWLAGAWWEYRKARRQEPAKATASSSVEYGARR